jgi:hypothetical protein
MMNIELTDSQVNDLKGLYGIDRNIFNEYAGKLMEQLIVNENKEAQL